MKQSRVKNENVKNDLTKLADLFPDSLLSNVTVFNLHNVPKKKRLCPPSAQDVSSVNV
jgi:hypothetical protein